MLRRDEAERHRPRYHAAHLPNNPRQLSLSRPGTTDSPSGNGEGEWDLLLELLCEGHLVEEHPRVAEPLVEALLELLHARQRALELRVPHEHEQHGVRAPRAVRAELVFRVRVQSGRGIRGPLEVRGDVRDGGQVGVVLPRVS